MEDKGKNHTNSTLLNKENQNNITDPKTTIIRCRSNYFKNGDEKCLVDFWTYKTIEEYYYRVMHVSSIISSDFKNFPGEIDKGECYHPINFNINKTIQIENSNGLIDIDKLNIFKKIEKYTNNNGTNFFNVNDDGNISIIRQTNKKNIKDVRIFRKKIFRDGYIFNYNFSDHNHQEFNIISKTLIENLLNEEIFRTFSLRFLITHSDLNITAMIEIDLVYNKIGYSNGDYRITLINPSRVKYFIFYCYFFN